MSALGALYPDILRVVNNTKKINRVKHNTDSHEIVSSIINYFVDAMESEAMVKKYYDILIDGDFKSYVLKATITTTRFSDSMCTRNEKLLVNKNIPLNTDDFYEDLIYGVNSDPLVKVDREYFYITDAEEDNEIGTKADKLLLSLVKPLLNRKQFYKWFGDDGWYYLKIFTEYTSDPEMSYSKLCKKYNQSSRSFLHAVVQRVVYKINTTIENETEN